MKVIQRYEKYILYFYLEYMKQQENEIIRTFLEENELNFLYKTLLREGSKFLRKRILIICSYIAEHKPNDTLCRDLINSYVIVVNEQMKWYLIIKILVLSEMIIKNKL